MQIGDRPRERLLQMGAEALSSAELLAVILGNGTKSLPVMRLADELLSRFGSLMKLADATVAELCQVKGIGQVKAIQLKAALTAGARAVRMPYRHKRRIATPFQAYQIIKEELVQETREIFLVILLDVKSRVITHEIVAIGTLTNSLVHPREVFYPAIRHKAASILLAHNHPSGDLTPSDADLRVTRLVIEAGCLLDIPVLDHLIVGASGYVSMRQEYKDIWKRGEVLHS
ncbi:MAG: DNA repair protein RadC [Parachlamydia sp.]|nr:DNA repair protein RadC [Parachlamydia sp.]